MTSRQADLSLVLVTAIWATTFVIVKDANNNPVAGFTDAAGRAPDHTELGAGKSRNRSSLRYRCRVRAISGQLHP